MDSVRGCEMERTKHADYIGAGGQSAETLLEVDFLRRIFYESTTNWQRSSLELRSVAQGK